VKQNRQVRISAFLCSVFLLLSTGCEGGSESRDPKAAIASSANNEAQRPFARDFADFYAKLTSQPPAIDDSIYGHSACMMIGASKYPDMKKKIDLVLKSHPVGGTTLRYGEPVKLQILDMKKAAIKAIASAGMTAGRLEITCGGTEIPLTDRELDYAFYIGFCNDATSSEMPSVQIMCGPIKRRLSR